MTKKLLKINNIDVSDAKGFIFDGCHKFYVCSTWKEVKECRKEGDVVHNMNHLQYFFNKSCPLRFINWINLNTIVKQFVSKVTFKYNTGNSICEFT